MTIYTLYATYNEDILDSDLIDIYPTLKDARKAQDKLLEEDKGNEIFKTSIVEDILSPAGRQTIKTYAYYNPASEYLK